MTDTEGKRTFFLGSNTPDGLNSLYEAFRDEEALQRCYLLKGGPGCGKSTLMKKVAAGMEEKGEPVEYIRCSGDPDSLDGVLFPRLRAALLDATAPHIMEPRLPGAVDHYLDLGRYYDRKGLQPLTERIREGYHYRDFYQRAGRCLRAVVQLREDDRDLLLTPSVERKLRKRAAGILSRSKAPRSAVPDEGREILRFLDAVTCQGHVCHWETVNALCSRVYELVDPWGLADVFFQTLSAGFRGMGWDVVVCLSPLTPDRIAHILVPGLSLAFVTGTAEEPYPGRAQPLSFHRRIRVDAMIEEELLRRNRTRLRFSRRVSAALFREAVDALAAGKAAHDALEQLYHPYVDFPGVEREAEAVLSELWEMQHREG